MLSPCGVDCGICSEFQKSCAGCREIGGEVFWAEFMGKKVCPMYDCPVNEKKLNHCGECENLPCQHFYDCKDPSITDEEHEKSINERVELLREYK